MISTILLNEGRSFGLRAQQLSARVRYQSGTSEVHSKLRWSGIHFLRVGDDGPPRPSSPLLMHGLGVGPPPAADAVVLR